MRILIAPDSLKESLSSEKAAEHIGNGIRKAMKDAELIPDFRTGTPKLKIE
jgi:glycerate kinase